MSMLQAMRERERERERERDNFKLEQPSKHEKYELQIGAANQNISMKTHY